MPDEPAQPVQAASLSGGGFPSPPPVRLRCSCRHRGEICLAGLSSLNRHLSAGSQVGSKFRTKFSIRGHVSSISNRIPLRAGLPGWGRGQCGERTLEPYMNWELWLPPFYAHGDVPFMRLDALPLSVRPGHGG